MTTRHPKRRVFYSFHFAKDAWRAGQVRNIGVTEHDEPVTDNAWEQVRRGGDAAIRRWIDGQMHGRSCAIVLIGAETANRKWVNHEIAKAWNDPKGLFGICIHKLHDRLDKPSPKGRNPFDYVKFSNGTSLAGHVKVYDPPGANGREVYRYIANHLDEWVEAAIQQRR